jgi:hypothetical protein
VGNEIETSILQRLNAVYKEDFHAVVPDEEFCNTHSLSRQQLHLVVSPMLAQGLVEEYAQSLSGYQFLLAASGTLNAPREFARERPKK